MPTKSKGAFGGQLRGSGGLGGGILPEFRDMMGPALQHDLTELPGLDYLSAPNGAIATAQAAAAAAFGADETFLLVNGTTAGVHAAVLATCRPGDDIILARNCHLSAFSACVLAGCQPAWVDPVVDPHLGVAHCVTPEVLHQGLAASAAAGRPVGAVLLVSPTYFGACCDIAGCARVCHAAGMPLIVDEAHGAPLAFLRGRDGAPAGALAAGADVAVQSSHKTLSALGQASMLHMRGERVDRRRLASALQVLQTSSPSYLLMASLDAARAAAQQPGAWDAPLHAARLARAGLRALPGLTLLEDFAAAGSPGVHALDPLRLTVAVSGWGFSGRAVAAELDTRFGVVPELATQEVVVFALGAGSARAAGMSPRDAFFAEIEQVPADAAVGRLSAELLCPYPPGVPAALPGEVLTADTLAALRGVLAAGGKVTGAADETLRMLSVIVEHDPQTQMLDCV
ncbi:hypothetical protein WJX81_002549 [Elliptochloris bilobata]|uniref:Arginine decarboxylase n=1 Tax=Elliptochloris bilobata TaxID=381761 RepID=A0AAW1RIC0_9CHLO